MGGLQASRSMWHTGHREGGTEDSLSGADGECRLGRVRGWAFQADPGVWKAAWSLGGRRLAEKEGEARALPKDPPSEMWGAPVPWTLRGVPGPPPSGESVKQAVCTRVGTYVRRLQPSVVAMKNNTSQGSAVLGFMTVALL